MRRPPAARRPLVPGPGVVPAYVAVAAALVSLPVSVAFGTAGVMLFLLVLGGVAATLWSRLPGAVQAAVVLGMVASGWAGVLGWYEEVWWLDLAAHLVLTGLLAVLAVAVLETAGWLRLVPTGRRAERAGAVVVVTAVGLALSVLWELGEWAGHRFVDDAINVGYDDTLGDLAMGGLGSALAGVAWASWTGRRRVAA